MGRKSIQLAANSAFREALLQWSLGMYVSIPIIAILQGSYHLSEYRTNHADAPRPAMPVRGVTVAVKRGFLPSFLSQEKPLRLLVVGDSLAAGVGISKSGVPILPESIARCLSRACGGRPVAWTCMGTPGISASQIVRDIHEIETHEPGRIDILFREWKAKRRKWQERRAIRRRLTELQRPTVDDVPNRNYFKAWWESLRRAPEKSPATVKKTTTHFIQEWWSEVTSRLKITRERIKEDIVEIQEIVQNPIVDEKEHSNNDLIHPGHPFKRGSVDPEVVAHYDIAVVLTGLNDLKDAFMPHMTRGTKSNTSLGTETRGGGLSNQLRGILDALEAKMDLNVKKENASDSQSLPVQTEGTINSNKRPLVVVPELPIAPLHIFQLAPLCWFLIPLFRAMENNKKFLSSSFPEHVIFIPQPNLKWWSDVEAGLGPIRENIRQDRLLLELTDVTQTVKDRIQKLMAEHYYPNSENDEEDKASIDDKRESASNSEEISSSQGGNCQEIPCSKSEETSKKGDGSSYVAMDRMHPNDEGYELWGRHIAEAIIVHWNSQ